MVEKRIYVFESINDREDLNLVTSYSYNDSVKDDRDRALYEIQSEIQGRFLNPTQELLIIDGEELKVTSKTITMIEGRSLEDYQKKESVK